MENHFNCIYCYINKINGKKYVGQAVDFNKRHNSHINQAYNKNHQTYNQYFHNAIRKYGIDNFEFEILKENLQDYEELNYWERYYIAEFDLLAKNGKGYNLSDGGENGNTFAGKTDEEIKEIRRKQSEAVKGEKNPWYGKTGENHPRWGKNHSDETKAKMSKANKGELVAQIDKDTNKIVNLKYNREYIRLGYTNQNITSCCKGRYKTSQGYIWKYLSDCTDEQINEYIIRTKPISVISSKMIILELKGSVFI